MSEDITLLASAILQAIIYADVFDYPLTAGQIQRYLPGLRAPIEIINEALEDNRLVPGMIARSGSYFTLPGREYLAAIRHSHEERASLLWHKALAYGRLIAHLPFIRMLAVTGSLTMNNVDGDADIDYMIVSAPRHLWTCRALVIGMVRLAGLQGFNLCPNYMITENALEFSDRNLYTAHELAQMAPLYGKSTYVRMRQANKWMFNFLPNAESAPDLPIDWDEGPADVNQSRLSEKILSTPPGEWFEQWERERKIHKFNARWDSSPEVFFSADICKGHYQRHGQSTQRILRRRLEALANVGTLTGVDSSDTDNALNNVETFAGVDVSGNVKSLATNEAIPGEIAP